MPEPVRLQPRIRIHEGGAVCEGGAFTLNVDGSVLEPLEILAPTGERLKLRVAALAASDPQTGQRVWLASLREDCVGVVLAGEPLRIAWTNAFVGVNADIILQYNINSILHDVYLREPIELGRSDGLTPARARLELWSMVFEAPEPRKTPRTISLRTGDATRPAPPGQADKTAEDIELAWSAMRMIEGRAFRVNAGSAGLNPEKWPVAKSWQTLDNKRYLVETLDYEALQPALESLRAERAPKAGARPPGAEAAPGQASGHADPPVRET